MTGHIRLARHRLEDGTRDLIGKEIAERVRESHLDSDANEALLAGIGAFALSRYLPGEILNRLQVFSATGSHAVILSNLPTQDFPPTPVTGYGTESDLAVINALQFGLLQLLGTTPFAVDYENDGRLIRNVVPNPAASGTTSSWGADSDFFWHSDNPHLPFGEPGSDHRLYVPRYLSFYAVRNEERVPTELAALEEIADRLDAQTLRELQLPQFRVGAPASNDVTPGSGPKTLSGVPLLELGSDGRFWVRYDRGTSAGEHPAAQKVLDRWVEVLEEVPSNEFTLDAGEFLIFDNYRSLHRRRAFTPGPVTEARWLRRCYAS
jgi:hypothetical protein